MSTINENWQNFEHDDFVSPDCKPIQIAIRSRRVWQELSLGPKFAMGFVAFGMLLLLAFGIESYLYGKKAS